MVSGKVAVIVCGSSPAYRSAPIHLGTRTVLEYFLSPVQKVVHEAGRKR